MLKSKNRKTTNKKHTLNENLDNLSEMMICTEVETVQLMHKKYVFIFF